MWCLEILQRHYRALNARDKARVDGLFAPVGRISKILNARQISAGMDDLFAMPKPSLKGSHITLTRRGVGVWARNREIKKRRHDVFLTKLFLTAGIIVVVTEVAKRSDKFGGLIAARR